MKSRLEEYKLEQSPVQMWIEERCERLGEDDKWSAGGDLFADFTSWAEAAQFRRINRTEWTRALNQIGLRSRNTWVGRGRREDGGSGSAIKGWPLRVRAGMEARF
jgi:phage/plasmid-associated DNA primase